ncbi:hypothetical protein [Sphingopyxis panaciterrae]
MRAANRRCDPLKPEKPQSSPAQAGLLWLDDRVGHPDRAAAKCVFSVKFGSFPRRRRASANEAGLPIACLAPSL